MMMMPSIFGGNLFNDDWMDFSFPDIDKELYGKHAKNLMKTDVKEKDGNYEVAIDLPGFKKDEITAELKDGYLTISAAKGLDKDEKDKEGKYIRRERYAGNMSRSFYVGDQVTEDDIHPKYEKTTITCACGNVIETGSTKKDIRVEICSKCHPFFTGKQKLVDTGGRVDRFKKRFGMDK